jgi:hypothetical protein
MLTDVQNIRINKYGGGAGGMFINLLRCFFSKFVIILITGLSAYSVWHKHQYATDVGIFVRADIMVLWHWFDTLCFCVRRRVSNSYVDAV